MHAVTATLQRWCRRLHLAALRTHYCMLISACGQAARDTDPAAGDALAILMTRAVQVRLRIAALGGRP